MTNLYPNDEEKMAYARTVLQRKARDNTRIPMQWTPERPNAGFCPSNVTPWMRVNDDSVLFNAEAQMNISPTGVPSVREFWKNRLLDRKERKDISVYGDFEIVGEKDNENVVAYKRFTQAGASLIVLNFSGKSLEWEIPEGIEVQAWVVSNYALEGGEKPRSGTLALEPWEGLMGECL